MTNTAAPTVELTLAACRLVAERETLRRRTIATANAVVSFLGRLVQQVFPSQRSTAPFGISPGHGVELVVDIHATDAHGIHLYAESGSVLGGIELEVMPAQFVPLDAEGFGRALVKASALDERATGQADLRIVAVHPDHPEDIAAELSGIGIAQEGTGALVVTVLAALLLFGFIVQTVFGSWPVLSVMIFVALIFMALNAPKLERVRFESRRLLPWRQRLASSAWALGGMAVWVVAMTANLLSDSGCSLDCGPGDVIVDNLTAVGASFGMAACLALAVSPALRPRQLAGRLLILAAVTPLFFYDLTLVGLRIEGARSATLAWQDGYAALGWGLAVFALLWVCLRYRSGSWWRRAALGLLAVLGALALFVVARGDTLVFIGADGMVYLWLTAAFLLLACVLCRSVLIPAPRWRLVRTLLFAIAIGALCVLSASMLYDASGNATPLYAMMPPAIAVLWMLAEVSLWQWWQERRRTRRRSRSHPAPAAAPEATPEPANTGGEAGATRTTDVSQDYSGTAGRDRA